MNDLALVCANCHRMIHRGKALVDGQCPRVYLARVGEVARFLKHSRKGHGETILFERHEWKTGVAAGTVDTIPDTWRFSEERVDELLKTVQ